MDDGDNTAASAMEGQTSEKSDATRETSMETTRPSSSRETESSDSDSEKSSDSDSEKSSNASISPSETLEYNLHASLDALVKLIAAIASNNETDQAAPEQQENGQEVANDDDDNDDIHHRLHVLASKAHGSLLAYGYAIEMGKTVSPTASMDNNDPASDMEMSASTRGAFREVGKQLWTTIKSHPLMFQDQFSHSWSKQSDYSETTENHPTKQPVNRNENSLDQGGSTSQEQQMVSNEAAASGYVRVIAARLVLIDHIHTKGMDLPILLLTPCSEALKLSENEDESMSSPKESTNVSLPLASVKELELGVKCFSRSGRSIYLRGDDKMASFVALHLSTSFWEGLAALAKQDGNHDTPVEARAFVTKTIDEAFDAFSLLPDAASLIGSNAKEHGIKRSRSTMDEVKAEGESCRSPKIGSSSHVRSQLLIFESFVERFCSFATDGVDSLGLEGDEESNPTEKSVSVLAIHRYLPGLAKVSYKHGNRFAREKEYDNAYCALRIALGATDRCLAYIGQGTTAAIGSDRVSPKTAFALLEQEMLVVSKECFYVLSHVCQAIGKKEEAHKFLDRIESYIDEGVHRDDEQFTKTMNYLNDGRRGSSVLALEDSTSMDLAEIETRAQRARARSKSTEATERSNLAFSRIMLLNRSVPSCPTQEDEALIDKRLKELAELSTKFFGPATENHNHAANGDISSSTGENDALKLALSAARNIRVRRVLAAITSGDAQLLNARNPYDILLQVYGSKRVFVVLDHLKSLVICLQMAYEKHSECGAGLLSALDEIGVEVARDLVQKTRALSRSRLIKSQSRPDSTLLPASDSGWELVVRNSQTHFAQALSFYRSQGAHKQCVEWADFLIEALGEFSQDAQAFTTSQERPGLQESTKQTIAEVTAVKALALCKCSDNFALALKMAREALEGGPTLHTVTVLFHCACVAETKSKSGESLLELDSALARLTGDAAVPASHADVLSIFPILSTCCSDNEPDNGGPLLLGIQYRWILKFVETIGAVCSEDGVITNLEPVSGEISLFTILKAYLRNAELLWESWSNSKDSQSMERCGENLDRALDGVLVLLCKLRGRTARAPALVSESDSSASAALIWDDVSTRNVVGEKRDCVLIAEQLWNIAILGGMPSVVSSNLFAKAHDFALLSEEEMEVSRTKGHLVCDVVDSVADATDIYASFILGDQCNACDLSSEFSATCLLLSVSTAVDNSPTDTTAIQDEHRGRMRRCLAQLCMARGEFAGNCEQMDYVGGLISWLQLQCLIEIADDKLCSKALIEGGLLARVASMESLSSHSSGDEGTTSRAGELPETSGDLGLEKSDQDGINNSSMLGPDSMVSNIFLMSCRAKLNRMPETTMQLLQRCVKELIQRGDTSVSTNDGNLHSLGEMQRSLLHTVTLMEDVVSVFDGIDSAVKACSAESSVGGKTIPVCYSTSELDWFAIEAYNRGLNLFFLGDLANAERLMTVALNLLPFCGAEAASHGAQMRQAYRSVIEQKATGGSILSDASSLVVSLFGSGTF